MGKTIRYITEKYRTINQKFKQIRAQEGTAWVRHGRGQSGQQKLPSAFMVKTTTAALENWAERVHIKVALLRYRQQNAERLVAKVEKLRRATESTLDNFALYYESEEIGYQTRQRQSVGSV